MKRTCLRILTGFWVVCGLISFAPRTYAVLGVGDTTIIAGDMTDVWKWPRELQQWTMLINNVNRQIQKTDELIKIVGDPKQIEKKLFASMPTLMRPLDEAISLKTRAEFLDLADSAYRLSSAARHVYKDANKISANYRAFGKEYHRDENRYIHYAMEEAMYDRYTEAVKADEKVAKVEAGVQKEAAAALAAAQTEFEVELANANIAASKQRQDLAHQRAVQAKAEMDAVKGKLGIEDAKKTEADREWAQTMVEEMRKKALDAYKAQFGISDDSTTASQ